MSRYVRSVVFLLNVHVCYSIIIILVIKDYQQAKVKNDMYRPTYL